MADIGPCHTLTPFGAAPKVSLRAAVWRKRGGGHENKRPSVPNRHSRPLHPIIAAQVNVPRSLRKTHPDALRDNLGWHSITTCLPSCIGDIDLRRELRVADCDGCERDARGGVLPAHHTLVLYKSRLCNLIHTKRIFRVQTSPKQGPNGAFP